MPLRLLVLSLVLLAPTASAGARTLGFGLGLELPPVTLAEDVDFDHEQRLVSLEVPFFAGGLRFAPAVGYASGRESPMFLGSPPKVTRLSAGAAVTWSVAPTEKLRGWAGPRGGLVWREVDGYDPSLDPFVGLLGGGEYFLGPSVSLGAELRLTYASLGLGRFAARRIVIEGDTTIPGGSSGPFTLEPVRGWSLVGDVAVSLRFYPW